MQKRVESNKKSIHVLGICGTFMAGLATLTKAAGYRVTGSDAQVYPPMSTQLQEQGIELIEGFDPAHIPADTDLVVIGNAMSRGNPSVEYVLNQGIPYQSGPEFLAEHCLRHQWVLAVAGTHGKTTTASMLAWILEYAGLNPGFLIGGVPGNFSVSARAGNGEYFVIEADEYDSAFFDKRSKFLHYRPRTLILNNLEFDHADIFDSLDDIKKQFHQLVRTVPSEGLIITPSHEAEIADVLERGCWSPVQYINIRLLAESAFAKKGEAHTERKTGVYTQVHEDFGTGATKPFEAEVGLCKKSAWQATDIAPDASRFSVIYEAKMIGEVIWPLIGLHNVHNALAAIAAAHHIGVKPEVAIEALASFINTKRRMELKGCVKGITVYDDFAHHPTAIATTLNGLRNKVGKKARLVAVLELGSYTMKSGVHKHTLLASLAEADQIFLARPTGESWGLDELVANSSGRARIFEKADQIVAEIAKTAEAGDHIVIMSNKGFEGIHEKLLQGIAKTE